MRTIMKNVIIAMVLAVMATVSCNGKHDPVKPVRPSGGAVLHTLDDMDLSGDGVNSHAGEEQWSVLQPIAGTMISIPHKTLVAQVPASATEQQTAMYPRIKKLANGSYIMFYHAGQLASRCFCISSKDLKNWSAPYLLLGPEKIPVDGGKQVWQRYGNPDAAVLANGDILAVFSYRDDRYSSGLGGGLVLMRSKDNGLTWSSPQTIYEGANWEPYLLVLPDNTIHCYFTDCRALTKNSGTSVIMSTDGGKTWSSKTRCCRLYKYDYDGPEARYTGERIFTDQMPCFRVLNDGKTIAGFLEARLENPARISGSSYYVMSMVYNDGLEWKDIPDDSEGPQRRKTGVVNGAGGYISVFPSGETVISCNISNKFSMKVGDCTATRFNGPDWNSGWLQPFSGSGFWGSTEVINPHVIVGTMHTSVQGINVGQFYLNHCIPANEQPIVLDGKSTEWKNTDALYISDQAGCSAIIRAAKNNGNLNLCIERVGTGAMSFSLGGDVTFLINARGEVTTKNIVYAGASAKSASGLTGTVTEVEIPLSGLGDGSYLPFYAEIAGADRNFTFTSCVKGDMDTWQRIKL